MKRLLALVLTVAMMTTLTGCFGGGGEKDPLLSDSKEELIDYIRTLEGEATSASDQITQLEEQIKGIQGATVDTAAIKEFTDGTGRLTLNSIDGSVVLPVPLEYPNSTQSYNASTVNVSDYIKVKPSANWVMTLPGTQLELRHTKSDINGIIKVGGVDRTKDTVRVEDLTTVIDEFFKAMPPENVTYGRVYVDSDWKGMDAKAHTFINEEDAEIRCGMVGFGDICFTYFFTYIGEADPSKDELILSLLQSITVYNKQFRVE